MTTQGRTQSNVMRHQQGFSVLELMSAVTIIGILTAIALPTYRKVMEGRQRQQAQDLLYAIYAGERAYYFTFGTYLAVPPGSWNAIHMDAPSPALYTVVTPTPTTFTAQAASLGKVMTIDQDHALDTTGWPAP